MSLFPSSASLSRFISNLAGAVSSIALPAGCRLCDTLLLHSSRLPVCDACLSSFPPLTGQTCPVCGQAMTLAELQDDQFDFCRDCQEHRFAFQISRSFGIYRESLVRAVLLLKYERVEPLGVWFAKRLHELVLQEPAMRSADVIVPVPLHRHRYKERGFNQVDIFARPLSRLLKIPYRPVLLVRERPRPEQHLLHNEQRWDAVRGAFAIQKGLRVDNLRVLLLDDVMTTGATLDACSRALREAGAESVLGLTIARALRTSNFASGER
ncbi:MAG TPA: ComF family protein [Candidatus Acidoferrum sp.]